jgi:hypothetical protein
MLATFNPNNSSCISFSDPAFHIEQPKLLIIALEECAPPPRASHPPTTLYSDSFASSSSSSSSSSSYDSEDASAPDGEEEACTSYCSSDDVALDAATTQYIDDTFHVRMHRIEKWRGTTLPTGACLRTRELHILERHLYKMQAFQTAPRAHHPKSARRAAMTMQRAFV